MHAASHSLGAALSKCEVLTTRRKTKHQIYACVSSLLKNPEVAAHQLPTPLAWPETYSKVYYCISEAQSGCNEILDSSRARRMCCQDANLLM